MNNFCLFVREKDLFLVIRGILGRLIFRTKFVLSTFQAVHVLHSSFRPIVFSGVFTLVGAHQQFTLNNVCVCLRCVE